MLVWHFEVLLRSLNHDPSKEMGAGAGVNALPKEMNASSQHPPSLSIHVCQEKQEIK